MASSAVQSTALWLAIAPTNSFSLVQPITTRPQQIPSIQQCRFDCRRRKRALALSMGSFDDDDDHDALPRTTDTIASDGDGGDIRIDSDSNDDDHSIQNIVQQEIQIDDDYDDDDDDDLLFDSLEDRADLDYEELATAMSTETNDSYLIDNFWAWALQLQQTKSDSKTGIRPPRKNPRMRMFAYISQPIVEVRIIGLVLLSCFLEAINTIDDLPPGMHKGIDSIDTVCVYIFAVEFFLRWWSAGRFQLRYLAKPLASIDAIVVVIPLFLSGLLPIWDLGVMAGFFPYVSLPGWLLSSSANSALLNLRLLRILKFQRVLTDENTYMNFQRALGLKKTEVRPYQLQLARVIISISTLVSVSTGLIYTAEHEVNPQIPDYFTALYFGLTTLTTVGFGDITPVTFQGRLVVGGTILAGVAIIPAQAASLAEAYLDFQKERSVGEKRKPVAKREGITTIGREKCDKCGAGPHRNEASFCWSCGKMLD